MMIGRTTMIGLTMMIGQTLIKMLCVCGGGGGLGPLLDAPLTLLELQHKVVCLE